MKTPTTIGHGQLLRHKYMMQAVLWAWATVLGLTGCTVGPNFHAPAKPAQTQYLAKAPAKKTGSAPHAATGAAQVFVRGKKLQRNWYRLYQNAALNRLIKKALAANPTREAAVHRVAAAHEAVNVVYGGRYPSLRGGIGVNRERQSGVPLGISNSEFVNTFNLYQAQVSAAYNLDIFGELTRRIENVQAKAAVARDKLLDAEATLVDNVITTALAEAGARTTRNALAKIAQQQAKTVKLIQAQERLGAATNNAVLRSQSQLAATQALIPDYRQQIAVARHRMAILLGIPPAQYHGPKFVLDDFKLPQTVPLSLPAELVNQRPDILAARDLLHAASARVGVATAEELPQIRLTASYSRAALKLNEFNSPMAELFSIGAGLTAPLFEGGKLRASKREAMDNFHAASADYHATVLKAFDQVADSLRALDNDATRLAARNRGRQAAEDSAKLAQAQFQAGSADLVTAYLARVQLTQAEIHYATARLSRLVDTATLVRALGGGWWPQRKQTRAAPASAASSTNITSTGAAS